MAYKAQRTIHNISFAENHTLHGLNMKTKTASIKEFATLAKMLTKIGSKFKQGIIPESGDEALSSVDDAVRAWDSVTEIFASKLISWDMELDDVPVPATLEGIKSLEDNLVMIVVEGWMEAIGGTPDPLERNSTNGESLPEVTLPMELPSLNLPN